MCLSLSLSAASNISFPVQLTDLLVGMCQHCLSSNIGLKNICLEVRSFRRAQKSPEETFPFKGIATSNFHHPPPDAAVVMLPGKRKRGKRKRKRKRRKKKKGKERKKERERDACLRSRSSPTLYILVGQHRPCSSRRRCRCG